MHDSGRWRGSPHPPEPRSHPVPDPVPDRL